MFKIVFINENQGTVRFATSEIELIFDPAESPFEVNQHVWDAYLKDSGLFKLESEE